MGLRNLGLAPKILEETRLGVFRGFELRVLCGIVTPFDAVFSPHATKAWHAGWKK